MVLHRAHKSQRNLRIFFFCKVKLAGKNAITSIKFCLSYYWSSIEIYCLCFPFVFMNLFLGLHLVLLIVVYLTICAYERLLKPFRFSPFK